MKLLCLILLFCTSAFAEGQKTDFQKASKRIEKRKGYCSPLDKMMKKCETADDETDKKIVDKTQKKLKDVSKKVEKREDYCSPLDKLGGKCGKKD